MKKILITGAASAIAQATARLFAKEGSAFFLIDRNADHLAIVAQDLITRGAASVNVKVLDLNDFPQHEALLQEAEAALGGINVALIAHGTLPRQHLAQASWSITHQELSTNFLSAASLLTYVANHFETKQHGVIAVISSVAGDRGRQSNYVYGTAKGALTIFTAGLRNRLAKVGVSVITIKPGFVDTPMTAEFKKGLLWAKPEVVGRAIHTAIIKKKDLVYTPWFWRYIMLIIRMIPERVFKQMKL